jgi:hypothetical protein
MIPVLNPVAFEVALPPAQPSEPVPPLPVQESALVLDQVMTALPPGAMVEGVSVNWIVGAGTAPTPSDLLTDVVPPAPVQLMPYV